MALPMTDQSAVVAFLKNPKSYPHPVDAVTMEETHGAYVFLAGERAYKLKKAVFFPYMDYSTLAKRQEMTEREVRLNQRTAPELYLDVWPIYLDGSTLQFKKSGDVVDYVVVMQRFDPALVLDKVAGRGELTGDLVQSLAQQTAELHTTAAIVSGIDGYDAAVQTILGNDGQFAGHADILDRGASEQLRIQSLAMAELIHEPLSTRAQHGFLRQCHGDLHLRNIAMVQGQPILFDCIEFNDAFAQIDVLYDMAFLLMDLDYRGYPALANLAMNEYLNYTQDYAGLVTLPLFLSMRAAVRAHVNVSIGKGFSDKAQASVFFEEGKRYLDLALAYLQRKPARLIALGGFSGAGKTTVARAIAPDVGIRCGAVILRSDVLRKQLAGTPLLSRLPESAYTEEASAKVYRRLLEVVQQVANTGYAIIVDAVFAKASERDALAALAAKQSLPFHGFWLEASADIAQQRIAQRQGDASDATPAVRAKQQHTNVGFVNWQLIDADKPQADTIALIKSSL